MAEAPAKDPQVQRKAALRTVRILAAVALALFAATIWSFLQP
jgi:hypothetical protein